jgi:hypothetical protein
MAIGIFDERTVQNYQRRILPADGAAALSLVPVNSSDRRIDTILVVNRDSIAHVLVLSKTVGGVTTNLGSASIPAGTGYAGTPCLDLLALIFPATQVGLNLQPADVLSVSCVVAVQATFDLDVTATGGVF